METGYQRGRIQDESMRYEQRKHDGSLPIVGVNTFLDPKSTEASPATIELARSTDDEKRSQLERLHAFQARPADERPAMPARLRDAALAGRSEERRVGKAGVSTGRAGGSPVHLKQTRTKDKQRH